MVCTSPTPCSRFGSIGSIAYDASLRQGVCLTISVTKSDQIWGIQKQDFVKCLKTSNLQSLFVPRAGAKMLVIGGDYCEFICGY